MFNRIVITLLCGAVVGAIWWFTGVINENNQLNMEVKQLKNDNAQQVQTIEELERSEQRNRITTSQQLLNEQRLRSEYDELYKKYKDELNRDTCADQLLPDHVIKLLQQ